MKKRTMLILLSLVLVFTLVGTPVLAKDPDKGVQGQPFQDIWDAIDEAVSAIQEQLDEIAFDLNQLMGDIDSIVQEKVDEALATFSVDWSQILGIPADLADGDDVGITSESDPTVDESVKDGVDWNELSGIPTGFADGVDDVGNTEELLSRIEDLEEEVAYLSSLYGPPTLYVDDVTVREDSGDAIFTVALSSPSSFPVTVDYSTADGTAGAVFDYTPISGTLTLPPGETTGHISVPIVDDVGYEVREIFFLNLSNPINATFSNSRNIVTIISDDEPPTP
jgi:hypothetical protein